MQLPGMRSLFPLGRYIADNKTNDALAPNRIIKNGKSYGTMAPLGIQDTGQRQTKQKQNIEN